MPIHPSLSRTSDWGVILQQQPLQGRIERIVSRWRYLPTTSTHTGRTLIIRLRMTNFDVQSIDNTDK